MDIKLGEHGFVRYVDHMGSDARIVQAARVSYGDGTKTTTEDKALIHYLLRHGHTSPFEMVKLTLHIKCTIFEARQLVRHRMANWNEVSGRYSQMPGEFWLPKPEDVRAQGKHANKQSSGGNLDPAVALMASEMMAEVSKEAYDAYTWMLDNGVAREQARAVLPLSLYTEFYWTIDGNNLLKVLALRDDAHTQQETQELARGIKSIARELFPWMMEASDDVFGGARLTKKQLVALAAMLKEDHPSAWTLDECIEALHTRIDDEKRVKGSIYTELLRALNRGS